MRALETFDCISVRGIVGHGRHGVLAAETELGQQFRVDVDVFTDTREAGRTDDLDATINYAEVTADVMARLTGPPQALIERVAELIAADTLARPRVAAVRVRIHKPSAPISAIFDDVAVTITRYAEVASAQAGSA